MAQTAFERAWTAKEIADGSKASADATALAHGDTLPDFLISPDVEAELAVETDDEGMEALKDRHSITASELNSLRGDLERAQGRIRDKVAVLVSHNVPPDD